MVVGNRVCRVQNLFIETIRHRRKLHFGCAAAGARVEDLEDLLDSPARRKRKTQCARDVIRKCLLFCFKSAARAKKTALNFKHLISICRFVS